MRCHVQFNPIERVTPFDCVQEFFHEVRRHVFSYRICTTSIGKFAMGLIPIGYEPMNQTTSIGKFPIGSNPSKFLYYSFESNEPEVRRRVRSKADASLIAWRKCFCLQYSDLVLCV